MKKTLSILFALALVLSFSLVAATPVAAANTVSSSTIVFESQAGYTLTDNGDGTYSGVIPCKVGGVFDIYAKEGATAYMDDTPVVITGHDAWPTWTPDTPDWYQYSLHFYKEGTVQKWALRNHAGATAVNPWYAGGHIARGVPMSGTMNWAAMYAAETDVGAYLSGTGTAKYPGKAQSHGGGCGYWDMDWSWGSEAVPLEYPGFDVTVENLGGGNYRVTFIPGPTGDAATATGTGTASFATSHGAMAGIAGVAAPSLPSVTFPHGMFAFQICCLTPGQSVILTVTLPSAVPVGTVWWKYDNGRWHSLPNLNDNGNNIMQIRLTDGGLGDSDGVANGIIVDPGGPGNPMTVGWDGSPVSRAGVLAPWIALLAAMVAGAGLFVWKRRRVEI